MSSTFEYNSGALDKAIIKHAVEKIEAKIKDLANEFLIGRGWKLLIVTDVPLDLDIRCPEIYICIRPICVSFNLKSSNGRLKSTFIWGSDEEHCDLNNILTLSGLNAILLCLYTGKKEQGFIGVQ